MEHVCLTQSNNPVGLLNHRPVENARTSRTSVILKVEYVPDDIVGRDSEIEEYEAALQPIINGEYPRRHPPQSLTELYIRY